MTDQDHHSKLIEALRRHWREAGGPISLTSYLELCRPTIAPLLSRRVSWSWIGARVLAVYEQPCAEIPSNLPPLTARRKSIIELYSRTTRRRRTSDHVAADDIQAGVKLDTPDPRPPSRQLQGADPPGQRRARIKQSLEITSRLGQFD